MLIGIDFSLTSPGIVVLSDKGELVQSFVTTSKKKFMIEEANIDCHFIPSRKKPTEKDPTEEFEEYYKARRNNALYMIVQEVLEYCGKDEKHFVSLEGYAFSANASRVFDIAEATGIIKQYLYTKHISLRVHDPLSVKMWATGKGVATKEQMVRAADEEGYPVYESLIHRSKGKNSDISGPMTDLCDAYHLARMLYYELEIRAGRILLSDLTAQQRRIFLRVTEAYPVNVLDRPFIV